MAKAVFTHRFDSRYDDEPAEWYHFPATYLRAVERAVGDWIVYYEPRRGSGRLAYFATARVRNIVPDPAHPDHYYAHVTDYVDFPRAVPFREGDAFLESLLRKDDGTPNRGALGRAVRIIPDNEFDAILRAGLTIDPGLLGLAQAPETIDGFAEPSEAFERPIVQQLVNRKFRDAAFARSVKIAYQNRCALSGLSLRNGGGRPEVEAAHIRPVERDGPDTVRNGLALSGTLHWMFDRGLVAVDDDYSILIAAGKLPKDTMDRLLVPDRRLILPDDIHSLPSRGYLKYHREQIFAG